MSAVRLIHRTLAVTPPAAGAVALDGVHDGPLKRRRRTDGIDRASGVGVAVTASPENNALEEETLPSESAPSKGKKRRRCGGDNETSNRVGSGEGGAAGGDRKDGPSNDRGAPLPRTCSLFIAGEPMNVEDVPAALASVSSPKKTAVVGMNRGSGPRGREDWAGRRGADDLGRRIKGRLVALFHEGVLCGCSVLVEACLQVKLSVNQFIVSNDEFMDGLAHCSMLQCALWCR